MKRTRLHLLQIGITFCLWISFVESKTIDELCNLALSNNPELKSYEAEVTAMKGQRTQAGLWKNPEITVQYGERRIKGTNGALQNQGFTRELSLLQTFEFPGKGSLRKAIANRHVEAAELGLQQFKDTLQGQVRLLSIEYLIHHANATAAAEIAERSSDLLKVFRERPQTSTQQLLEIKVIEGSLMELQKSSIEFTLARDEVSSSLRQLLGLPPHSPLQIDQKISPPPHLKVDEQKLILLGLQKNLSLQIRENELRRATQEVTSAKLDIAPDFKIGPFFSQDRAGETEENFGGTLSATLPVWDWNQGNIAAAQARQSQADHSLLQSKRRLENEIIRWKRSLDLHQKTLQATPEKTMEQLQNAADLADRQYRTGGIQVQLYLEVQRQYLSSLKIQGETMIEAWKNWLDLELLCGGSLSTQSLTQH